jgi:GAF domain-containing protein
MIVGDASKDARFSDSALVNGSPYIRFYAGIPLVNAEGLALGTLCVIDHRPRRLSLRQREALKALARQVVALLEFRRVSTHLATALEHVKTLERLLPICSWCKRIRDDHGYWNQVDDYLRDHADADFTHGICPECLKKELTKAHRKRNSKSRLKSS